MDEEARQHRASAERGMARRIRMTTSMGSAVKGDALEIDDDGSSMVPRGARDGR